MLPLQGDRALWGGQYDHPSPCSALLAAGPKALLATRATLDSLFCEPFQASSNYFSTALNLGGKSQA